LNSDSQVLGFVEKAGAFNFNQVIATTRPSSAQEPGMEDLLFNVGDNVLSVEAANAFFSNEDQVQAVIDEFSKSQSK
jgi:putative NADH-flavin reductase